LTPYPNFKRRAVFHAFPFVNNLRMARRKIPEDEGIPSFRNLPSGCTLIQDLRREFTYKTQMVPILFHFLFLFNSLIAIFNGVAIDFSTRKKWFEKELKNLASSPDAIAILVWETRKVGEDVVSVVNVADIVFARQQWVADTVFVWQQRVANIVIIWKARGRKKSVLVTPSPASQP
jgi:hypothetical protein